VPSRTRGSVRAYIDAAGIVEDRKGWLFRTARGHNGSSLSNKPMSQPDAWRMIRRRAAAAGIAAEIGCHTFRATGITAYLANGGALEHAGNGGAREPPHDQALRPDEGAAHPGRVERIDYEAGLYNYSITQQRYITYHARNSHMTTKNHGLLELTMAPQK
jgi:hypothetical protein